MYLFTKYKNEFVDIKSVSISGSYNSYANSLRYKVNTNIDVRITLDLLDFSYIRDIDKDMFIKDDIIIYDGNKYYTLIGSIMSCVEFDDYSYEAIITLVVDIFNIDDEMPYILSIPLRDKTISDILD